MKKEVWSDLTMEDKSMIVCKGAPNKSGLECLMKEGWYEMPLYGSMEVVSRMDEEVVGWIQVSSLLQYLRGVGK